MQQRAFQLHGAAGRGLAVLASRLLTASVVLKRMPTNTHLAAQLKQALAGGRTTKILRFVLNLLSSTPFVGGIFSATATAWSEAEQGKVNSLLFLLQQYTDDQVTEIKGSLALKENPQHVVAGSIAFNPNTAEVFETYGITSVTDCGTLDFVVNFGRDLQGYVFMCYGSGPVSLKAVNQTPGGMRVLFEHPAPDRVTIAFFEPQPNYGVQPTPASGRG